VRKLVNVIDATKELNILRSKRDYDRPFEVVGTYRLIDDGQRPEATVIIKTRERETHEASTGVGPVDALANVLKKSLSSIFPVIQEVKLVDFSSRIHDFPVGDIGERRGEHNLLRRRDHLERRCHIGEHQYGLLRGPHRRFEYAILAKKVKRSRRA
jgi:hypothetical protein